MLEKKSQRSRVKTSVTLQSRSLCIRRAKLGTEPTEAGACAESVTLQRITGSYTGGKGLPEVSSPTTCSKQV